MFNSIKDFLKFYLCQTLCWSRRYPMKQSWPLLFRPPEAGPSLSWNVVLFDIEGGSWEGLSSFEDRAGCQTAGPGHPGIHPTNTEVTEVSSKLSSQPYFVLALETFSSVIISADCRVTVTRMWNSGKRWVLELIMIELKFNLAYLDWAGQICHFFVPLNLS